MALAFLGLYVTGSYPAMPESHSRTRFLWPKNSTLQDAACIAVRTPEEQDCSAFTGTLR